MAVHGVKSDAVFSIPVEDGFRDADLTVRDGLRQDAARDTNLIYQ